MKSIDRRAGILRGMPGIALLVLLSSPVLAQSGTPGTTPLTVADASRVLQIAAGLIPSTPDFLARYDVAPVPGTGGRIVGDGKIDISDAVRILQAVVGLVSPAQLYPTDQTELYAVDGGNGFSVPGYASYVDLVKYRAGNTQGAVTADLFATGDVPNAMAIAGGEGYIVNSTSNTLEFVNLTTHQIDGTPLFLGYASSGAAAAPDPYQVAVVGEKAYVTLQYTNEVAVIDLTTRKMVNRIPVGMAPEGITATAGGQVFVTNTAFSYDAVKQVSVYGQGSVSVIDSTTDTVVGTVNVPLNPTFARVDYAGRVHVACTGDYGATPGQIVLLQPVPGAAPNVLGSIPVGGAPGPIAFTLDGMAYVGSGVNGVMKYDPDTLTVLIGASNPIDADGGPVDLVADTRGWVYAAIFPKNEIAVIDSSQDKMIARIPVGPGPEGLAIR